MAKDCFTYTTIARYDIATVNQTHDEVLVRFQNALGGIGKIYGPYTPRKPIDGVGSRSGPSARTDESTCRHWRRCCGSS
jgi:hypothetical protein